MKRKIAIIADGWRRHITYAWIRGCRNYIKEHELDIEISVFHSFGNFSRDEKFNAGEYNIIHLPDLSQFDGIILEVTNMLNQKRSSRSYGLFRSPGYLQTARKIFCVGRLMKNICCRMPLSAQMRILRWGSAIRHSRKDLKFRLIFV